MVAHEKSIWFGCMLAESLFVLVLAGCGDVSESGSSQRAQPSKRGQPAETAESHAAGRSADCKPTPHDMLGPFYKPDAPVRTRVGSGYVLSGAVLATEECKPIPNARIEFWLANSRGDYDDALTNYRLGGLSWFLVLVSSKESVDREPLTAEER